MDFSKTIYIEENRYLGGRSVVIFNCDSPFILTKNNETALVSHMIKILQNSIELSIQNCNIGEFCVLVNLTNIKKCKLSIKFICGISRLLKTAFPDKLYKCFLQKPSVLFRSIYLIVRTVIDKETRDKITIVKNGENILYEQTLKPWF